MKETQVRGQRVLEQPQIRMTDWGDGDESFWQAAVWREDKARCWLATNKDSRQT